MHKSIYLILFLLSFNACKFRFKEDPFARPYWSIADSKKAGVFVDEYQPDSAYIQLNDKKYYIKEAWVEHPHTSGHFTDSPVAATGFAMSFNNPPGKIDSTTDLHNYVKELGNGNHMIWLYLPCKDCTEDTVVVYYKTHLEDAQKNKKLLLVRKSKN